MQSAAIVLPEVGTPFGGGFLANRFFVGDAAFGLIVSPAAEGDFDHTPWNESLKMVKGALSYNDGRWNTLAMAEAGSKLARRCLDLRIGGYDDWYLLSRQEGLMAFHELRNVAAFQEGGPEAFKEEYYWTSSQSPLNPDYAYVQSFGNGDQYWTRKNHSFRGRAVRRLPL